jgi:hypothetical protein
MTPFNFNRLSHRQKLAASLSGLGLTPSNLSFETKLPSGVVDSSLTVMAPSPLKNLTAVSLTAPSVESGLLARSGGPGLYSTAAKAQLDLRPGTGADPQPYTRASGSDVELRPGVLMKTREGRFLPADAIPSPQPSTDGWQAATGWMGSKTPMTTPPQTEGTFLGPKTSPGSFTKPPVEPPTEKEIGQSMVPKAIDRLVEPKSDPKPEPAREQPFVMDLPRLPPTPAPGPMAPVPGVSPLVIGGGILALAAVAYLITRSSR